MTFIMLFNKLVAGVICAFAICSTIYLIYVFANIFKFKKLYNNAILNFGIAKALSDHCTGVSEEELIEVRTSIATAIVKYGQIEHLTSESSEKQYLKLKKILDEVQLLKVRR